MKKIKHLLPAFALMVAAALVAILPAATDAITNLQSALNGKTSTTTFNSLVTQIAENQSGTSSSLMVTNTTGGFMYAPDKVKLDGLSTSTISTVVQTALNTKQNSIATGTISQYFKGDFTLGTTPTLATVATSGAYTDLSGKPTIPAAQIQSDWTQASTTLASYIPNKPTIDECYEGTTQRLKCFPIFKSVTVSAGNAIFYLTNDGTAGGTALFPNGVIADSVNVFVSDASTSYQASTTFSNSNKTLTVGVNKYSGGVTGNLLNILNIVLGQAVANGAVVHLQVWGY